MHDDMEKIYVDMDDEIPHTHLRHFVYSLMNSLKAMTYLENVVALFHNACSERMVRVWRPTHFSDVLFKSPCAIRRITRSALGALTIPCRVNIATSESLMV
jgi:hypothetical protein